MKLILNCDGYRSYHYTKSTHIMHNITIILLLSLFFPTPSGWCPTRNIALTQLSIGFAHFTHQFTHSVAYSLAKIAEIPSSKPFYCRKIHYYNTQYGTGSSSHYGGLLLLLYGVGNSVVVQYTDSMSCCCCCCFCCCYPFYRVFFSLKALWWW